ncbi:hypothetical protein, partial [Vibrio splendidus]|uniref:hypothetical protein n=1 Tax=Vibrio splendidus TaxID=29497 RepID=UPI0018E45C4B
TSRCKTDWLKRCAYKVSTPSNKPTPGFPTSSTDWDRMDVILRTYRYAMILAVDNHGLELNTMCEY